MPKKTSIKNGYDIEITHVFRELLKVTDELDIPKAVFKSLIKTAKDGLLQEVDNSSLENSYVIIDKTDNHHFWFWMRFQLATLESYLIGNCLDYHLQNFNDNKKFIDSVEFLVLSEWSNNVRFNRETHSDRVSSWIREKRLELNISYTVSYSSFAKKSTDFTKLNLGVDRKDIEPYLSQLYLIKHKGKSIMSKDDFESFVNRAFVDFGKTDSIKIFSPDIRKGVLQSFFYELFIHADNNLRKSKGIDYCKMLIENFRQFEGNAPENILKKWSNRPKKYPFKSLRHC